MEVAITARMVNPSFTFDKVFIRNVSVTLFKSAIILVDIHFSDPSGLLAEEQKVLSKRIEMSGVAYNNWLTDDDLINFVLTTLNLQKKV